MLDLNRIPEALRHEGGLSRRLFLGYATALAATPLLVRVVEGATIARPSFTDDPFSLGLTSGDPDHTGVVLWTKLAPKPLDPDGGMPRDAVNVSWEVAEDEAMKKVVRRGTATASPELAHSVHVEVDGLKPDRWYWYRFRAGDAETPVARTRTMPAPNAMPDKLSFAFASCQHYESGYYTPYQHMVKDDLDLIFFVGDYIYEGAGRKGDVREHVGGTCETLEGYRLRYAQYRTDPDLQAVHRMCPWFVTWDDHEVSNNHTATTDGSSHTDLAAYLKRRAGAYKAYYEYMPLRARSIPRGPAMMLYRSASFGRLAQFMVLDTRQYRTVQANGGAHGPMTAEALNPKNTILGAQQKAWLKDELTSSPATWNLLAQQVMMGCVTRGTSKDDEPTYAMDQWPSYDHERNELLQFMADRKVSNPVVISGDIHANFVNDLHIDDLRPETPVVAAEFVGTSITSSGDGVDQPKSLPGLYKRNPGLRYHNAERGYVRCTATAKEWKSDYVTVEKISTKTSKSNLRASFVVEAGKAGIEIA